MPLSKNAVIRYMVLDRCFCDKSTRYHIDDLVDACRAELARVNGTWGSKGADGVSRRQIYDDMNQMEMIYDVEIDHLRDGRRKYHTYAEGSKTLGDTRLRQDEINLVNDAIMILKRIEGLPQIDWIDDIENRLYTTSRLGDNAASVVSFQRNPYLKGMREWYRFVFNAIVNKDTLKLAYHPFGREAIIVVVSPYHLKQYNNRWFLIGKRSDYAGLSNFAIDRIEDAVVAGQAYEMLPEGFSFDDLFADVVGVSVRPDAPVQEVVLYVDPRHYPYIKSKPLHPSQRSKDEILPDGRYVVRLRLQENYELRSLLRSFGPEIEVAQPESLRNSMIEDIKTLNELYM